MTRLKPLGRLALIVAVGVAVGAVGQSFLQSPSKAEEEKTLKWEHLEGEEGSDLQRTRTPSGWVVENADGYLLNVYDPEHKWLEDE
jgi:hypothetical protein